MANYHVLRIDSLIESLTLCNAGNGFVFQLDVTSEVTAENGDYVLGHISSPIDEVRYIFEVESASGNSLVLKKELEVSKGVTFDFSTLEELQPIAYTKEFFTISEETFLSITSGMCQIFFGGPSKKLPTLTIATAQKIFYGCPGTGKSFEVKKLTEGEFNEDAIYFNDRGVRIDTPLTIDERINTPSNVFRTTFHPDYDYATFVGTYKPIMKPVDPDDCESTKEELSYDFVPQVFTNAYIRAYKSLEDETLVGADKNVYLIIEEINRGNCAQIFGDLFQLLDRTNGYSDYSVTPDTELKDYLCKQGIKHDKLRLPANLHIYATMNTSDQSLFPMDSAFKRRWAMEYIPIKLSGNKAENYKISLYDHEFKWTDFLKQVNAKIRMATDSEDKQMGEFFVKSDVIELDEFRNKIMFYIWNDVCKEHYSATRLTASYFMRDSETSAFTFAELFGGRHDQKDMPDATPGELILGFMKYIGVEEIPEPTAE